MKRIFDFTLAFLGIVMGAPVWVVCALAIWLGDFGPVLYCQDRVGRFGKIFKGFKFRSMIRESDDRFGMLQAQEFDPRITRIGKLLRVTAMDEFPQLLNILKGDMSFVGPRALVLFEKEVGDSEVKSIESFPGFKERSSVRPGLTGIAQIFAPRDIRREQKFKFDIWYVHNRSFALDLYVIGLSFLVTFIGKWESRKDKFLVLGRPLKAKVEKEIGDM